MTILYPALGSAELKPYEAPFGRMMLAYGRAMAATTALVELRKADEGEAAIYVAEAGTKELPKRIRRLLRDKLTPGDFEKLDSAMTRFKAIAGKRHDLIHGVWWFDKDGCLGIRVMRQRQAIKTSLGKLV